MQQLAIFDDLPEPANDDFADAAQDYRFERCLAKSAEFLAAYDISRRGLECMLAGEGMRYDLLVDAGGAIKRVQVKSNRRAVLRAARSKGRSYTFGKDSNPLNGYGDAIDLFALVALDVGCVLYVPAAQIVAPHIHLNATKFTPEMSDLSWSEATRGWEGSK